MIFHNRLSYIPNNHDHLIGNIVPPPHTLMMGIIGLDERMVGNTKIFKVPFILGGYTIGDIDGKRNGIIDLGERPKIKLRFNELVLLLRRRQIPLAPPPPHTLHNADTPPPSTTFSFSSTTNNSTNTTTAAATTAINLRNPVNASICWNIIRLSPDGYPTINVLCKSTVGDKS